MKPHEAHKRVGIWIRVSTEDQVRGESPEHHERRARLYAEAKGWDVIEVYRLDAMSGKTVKEYPETKRMRADVKRGHITGLIFSKLARLARNTRELLEFAEYFSEHHADLISLAESIDTSTPAGRLFYTMIAAMAEWEREEIADRVRASVPIRAKMGKPLGGAAPYGYAWTEGKLVIDLKEAPVRKLMYELFAETGKVKAVARLLTERGYRTRNGSEFSGTTVRRLLQDSTAKGIRRTNYTTSKDNTKAWEVKPEHEWVHHEVTPIVTDELWEVANANLEKRRMTGKRPARAARHLFAGVVHCHCGKKMYVPSNSPKYICQACRTKIAADDLEAIFAEELKRFFSSPEEISAELQASNKVITEMEELLLTLQAEAKKVTSTIDRLYDLYQAGEIDKKAFGERYAPLLLRKEQCDAELPALEAEIDVLRINEISHAEIVTQAEDLYSRWASLAFEARRHIVEAVAERIVVDKDGVEITLYYAPTGGGGGPSDDEDPDEGGMPSPIPQERGNKGPQLQGFIAATS